MTTVIETKNLKKTYMQGKIPIRALRGVDFKVEEGELISILGPSGSGKSTLLNMIGGLDLPTEGSVLINGKNTTEMNRNQLAELRRHIGIVFQYYNLIGRLTAFKNVEFPMTVAGMSKSERRKKTKELLTLVGLGDRMNHKPFELSGGEHQRVAIARALAQNPNFLLMDEPTGNIDTRTRDGILKLVKKLNEEQNITIIIITHDQYIAKKTKRTVFIVDGLLYHKEEEAKKAEYRNGLNNHTDNKVIHREVEF